MNIDLKDIGPRLAEQFQGLQGRHPGQWPLAPRLLCAAGVMALVTGLGYFFYWSGQFEQQEKGAREEQKLRDEYKKVLARKCWELTWLTPGQTGKLASLPEQNGNSRHD